MADPEGGNIDPRVTVIQQQVAKVMRELTLLLKRDKVNQGIAGMALVNLSAVFTAEMLLGVPAYRHPEAMEEAVARSGNDYAGMVKNQLERITREKREDRG